MRVLNASVMADKHDTNGRGGPWVWCIDLARDASNTSRLTSHNQDLTLDSNTYTAEETLVDYGATDANGTLVAFTLSFQNVDRVLSTYAEAGKFKGFPVAAYYLDVNYLDKTKAARVLRGTCKNITYNDTSISFVCGSNDLRNVESPSNRCYRLRCRHLAFKDFECKYAGGTTSCDRSYTACAAMANLANFGGFPAIPCERI